MYRDRLITDFHKDYESEVAAAREARIAARSQGERKSNTSLRSKLLIGAALTAAAFGLHETLKSDPKPTTVVYPGERLWNTAERVLIETGDTNVTNFEIVTAVQKIEIENPEINGNGAVEDWQVLQLPKELKPLTPQN